MNIFEVFNKLKKKPEKAEKPPSKEPRIYKPKHGWGNAIYILDWERAQLSGHLTPVPSVGDYFVTQMASGRWGVFKITEVDQMRDPPDMFFAIIDQENGKYLRDCEPWLQELVNKQVGIDLSYDVYDDEGDNGEEQ